MVEPSLELLAEEPEHTEVSTWILLSLIVHGVLLIWFATHHSTAARAENAPIARYVELMRQTPTFTEAPGKKVDHVPLNAPFSDANRRSSAPEPTGPNPTKAPGIGGMYAPSAASAPMHRASAQPQVSSLAPQPEQEAPQSPQFPISAMTTADSSLKSSAPQPTTTPNNPVEWRNAIQEVGKVASLGGQSEGGSALGAAGGEEGTSADTGPVSFETQWYDWGDYAEGMVRKIRQNWYNNMPPVIRMGLKGVVTIRFTIHRDGTISDITILKGSGIPPYDFAAQKALELSSRLASLPGDFPNQTERVTAQFYYNMQIPKH